MNAPSHELGHAVRHLWNLDPDWVTVNHGSFGATPIAVLDAQDEWRRRMEAQPTRFMSRDLPNALRAAADALGRYIGAGGNDLAFVENATVGCNAVLRSLRLQPHDEVVVFDHGYGAVKNTVRFVAGRSGARVVTACIPFPRPTADAIVENLAAALTPATRLAVLDHITSPSALVLPIAEMIEACRTAGVPVLVDGAHAPGQVPLDLATLGADYYVGNCHKWMMAPKGAGFLWAAPQRQDDLHPVTISHGLGKGFLEEFDWTGTRDPTSVLAVPAAITFLEDLGGASLRERNIRLARDATAVIARRLNAEIGALPEFAGSMGVVRLPVTGAATPERALDMRAKVFDAKTDVPVSAIGDGLWMRISAQAYNEIEDYERLAEIVARLV
ncbi:MAG TPA: aminotransferase class V-fold PLP-dependent enzyme [Acetobacteraceae bacterium]|jgi:isopenicillin-N epimerase|nr:aminotransferase class V-fold PLP-dependent enzyme [Acetobacteraceae bacterium]